MSPEDGEDSGKNLYLAQDAEQMDVYIHFCVFCRFVNIWVKI